MSDTCKRCGATLPTARLDACPICLLDAPPVPTVLGGALQLEHEIGRGGMGSVYKARHLRLGRTVAVKFMPANLASQPEFQARFEREARAMAMLNHPNIVTIHDYGTEGDQSYIVMEYVDGKPLSRFIPMPPSRAAEIMVQVCDALAYAHRQGVVHRDLKPENILIDSAGHVKVTDFGIARIVRPDAHGWTVTSADVAVGTPHYISPEALAGARPDPRMDIYSLGVVLYEMVMAKVPVGNFERPLEPLAPIILRALAPDPTRRFADAEEMRRALLGTPTTGDAYDLPPDEKTWRNAVAMMQAISTAIALWAFLVSVTPKKLKAGEEGILTMLQPERLPNGELLSRARFEMWWTIAALVTFMVAITGYGLLRRHWRRAGLEMHQPDRPVPEAKVVLFCGILSMIVYGIRKHLESRGFLWVITYSPIVGGILEVVGLFFLWISILEMWRTSRPLWREPLMWTGFAMALVPPTLELVNRLQTWTP